MSQRTVTILLFDDVEILDFAGPYEVFAVTQGDPPPFKVVTVAEKAGPISTRNALSVNPTYTIADCPPADILLIPGGMGTRRDMHNATLLAWIKDRAAHTELLLSVCTGALLLGNAGLLDGLSATTHHGSFDLLRRTAPAATVVENERFVDNGHIITAGGISAGIDMAFHVVARLCGEAKAQETADQMEYAWTPQRAYA